VSAESDRERQARWLARLLDVKGRASFPPTGWPGWTAEQHEQARADLDAALEAIGETRLLRVEEDEDGTLHVWDAARLN
jgi:hypothetical protein